MATNDQASGHPPKKTLCRIGRIVGIIGLLFILWAVVYAIKAISQNPKEILLVVLWGIMFIGGCVDIVRRGYEGIGGSVILSAGIISYLYLLSFPIQGQEYEGSVAAIAFSLPLFTSGLLFYLCGRQRRKQKK